MSTKIVAGGIVKKGNRFLLVKENQKLCKGQWNLPAGGVDDGENVVEAAVREIYEETGCNVKVTGILEIQNRNMENKDALCFLFDTELITDEVRCDGKEIADIQWFSYEEMISMKDKLRADGYFLSTIENKLKGKVVSLDLINTVR